MRLPASLASLPPMVEEAVSWARAHPALAVGGGLAGLLTAYSAWDYLSRPRGLPPGPLGLPYFGSALSLDLNRLHLDLQRMGEKYGDVYTFYAYGVPFVVLQSPAAVKEGLVTCGTLFAGRPYPHIFREIMHEEVFMMTYSEDWKQKKKFGETAVRKFGGPQSRLHEVVMNEVEYIVDTFRSSLGAPIDTADTFYLATANVMTSLIYGVTYEHDDPELLEIRDAIVDWYVGTNKTYPQSEVWPVWLQRMRNRDHNALLDSATERMRNTCLRMMRRVEDRGGVDEPTCLMEYFLARRGVAAVGGERVFADTVALYTPDAIDTVSVLLQWCVLYLASFPAAQAGIQAAIDKAVERTSQVTVSDRRHLGVVDSFITEVARHSNFVLHNFAHSSWEEEATFRGYRVPPQCAVFANFYGVNINPDVFPEPLTFKYDRFVDADGRFHKSDMVSTFSMGSRHCPGEVMSRTEIFLYVANILHQFCLAFPAGEPAPSLTMKMYGAFRMPPDFRVVLTERVSAATDA